MLGGKLKDLRRWGDLRLGRLQNRIPPWGPQDGRCLAEAAPGRVLTGNQPQAFVHRGTEGLPLRLEVADPGGLATPLVRNHVQGLVFSVIDRGWLCGAQGLDLPIRVAAVEFGVGRDGKMARVGGGLFPFLAVGHGLSKGLFSLLV